MTGVPAVALTPQPAAATTDGPSSFPEDLVAHGGFVWFGAHDNADGESLFKSDGTEGGTSLVLADVNPSNLTWIGNRLFFDGFDSALNNSQLFESDGTAAGTKPITSVAGGLDARGFVAFRGGVLFSGQESSDGGEPWFSRGVVGGTYRLKDIDPGSAGSFGEGFTVVGGGLTAVFVAHDGTHGNELWRTDGSASGTTMVKDIDPGPSSSFSEDDLGLIAYRNRAYFLANNGLYGYELWTTDGSAGGTRMVRNIGPGATDMTDGDPEDKFGQSNFLDAAVYRGELWFAANDGAHGNELWRTNGTRRGTRLAIDVIKGIRGADPENLTAIGGHLFFDAQDPAHGSEPWFTGGTAATTHRLHDINSGPGSSEAYNFVAVPSGVVFIAYRPMDNEEVWHSSIRAGRAAVVDEINPVSDDAFPDFLTRLGSKVLFTADDGTHGEELWVTDGTAGATHMVIDLRT